MQARCILALATVAASGCTPMWNLPLTRHPNIRPVSSAGIGIGSPYFFDAEAEGADTAMLVFPYGEGWARFAAGPGQLELRIQPGTGSIGYRFDVTEEGSSLVFALQPALGLGFFRTSDANDSDTLLFFAPALAAVLAFEQGTYLMPQGGYGLLVTEGRDEEDSMYMLGLAVGHVFATEPFAVSLELSVQRLKPVGNGGEQIPSGRQPAIWAVVPSIGLQLDAPAKPRPVDEP